MIEHLKEYWFHWIMAAFGLIGLLGLVGVTLSTEVYKERCYQRNGFWHSQGGICIKPDSIIDVRQ